MWAIGVFIALALGAAGFGIYRFRQRRKEMEKELAAMAAIEEDTVEEIELEAGDKSNYKRQIERFIDKNPEAAAQLLRSWLNED